MAAENRSWLARALSGVSQFCFRNPLLTLIIGVLAMVVSVWLGANRLQLKMDWTYLFEDNDTTVLKYKATRDLFPYPGDIAVFVDQGTTQQREAFLERLAARLAEQPDTFFHVFYRFDLKPLESKALYYLDDDTLEKLAAGLEQIEAGVGKIDPDTVGDETGRSILLKVLADLDASLKSRGRAEYMPIWQFLAQDQDGDAAEYLASLMTGERYVYPTLGGGKVHALVLKCGTRHQVLRPQDKAVEEIRKILADLKPKTTDLRIRLTGLPVMLYDEKATCTQDSIRSGIISICLIFIVFALGFGELVRPVLAIAALSFGLVWTVGFTTLAVGHLNFITVSLVTMLMGLGIDFGIHVVFRYDEELASGQTPENAMNRTMAGTGVDTFVGATATAAAFLAITFADFRGISDFGIIAAGGVMLCFLSTTTMLPALLAWAPGKKRPVKTSAFVAWFESSLLLRARWITLSGIFVFILCAFWATKVGFSYNLLSIQADNIESVRTELEMVNELSTTVLTGESHIEGREEARAMVTAMEKLPSVARVGSLLPLLPPEDPERQALIAKMTGQIQKLQMPDQISLESAKDLLAVQVRVQAMEGQLPGVARDPEVEKAIAALKGEVAEMGPGPIQDGLAGFQETLREDLGNTLEFLKLQVAEPPNLDDIPEDLRLRYVTPSGYYKMSIQPLKSIWEKENVEAFLDETLVVDPEMMGDPLVQQHILDGFNRAFERTPWFTLLGVLTVMVVYLRSGRAVMLSLLPTASGVLIIFAVMAYTGLDFNVVNFVALPMSVGIGAIYGVHALHRMRELRDETLLSSSTGPALLLSGVTTLVGFASLMTAHHKGLASLGFVISVGVTVNFVMSLFYLPSLRRFLKSRRARR